MSPSSSSLLPGGAGALPCRGAGGVSPPPSPPPPGGGGGPPRGGGVGGVPPKLPLLSNHTLQDWGQGGPVQWRSPAGGLGGVPHLPLRFFILGEASPTKRR